MKNSKSDKVRLEHINSSIEELETFTKNVSIEDFTNTPMIKWASIKELEIIGEATNHISQETQNLAPTIPWKKIIGMRNVLVHQYFGVDIEITWEIIQSDIPKLKKEIIKLLKKL